MTDRELLELAAKAAGMDTYTYCPWWEGMAQYNKDSDSFHGTTWNPLDNDGDALRLAVKLHLVIDTGGVTATRQKTYVGGHEGYLADESHGTDPYAATRRAIVRAATEIARSTQ